MPAKKPPIKRLSHTDRHLRRQKMAEAVRNGRAPGDVATKFGVTLATVKSACLMFRVTWPVLNGRKERSV